MKTTKPMTHRILKNLFLACVSNDELILTPEELQNISQLLICNQELHHLSPLLIKYDKLEYRLDKNSYAELKKISITTIANYIEKRAVVTSIINKMNIASEKFPIILLKAMAFNDNIYSNDSPRGCSDIDLITERKNTSKLVSILEDLGFKKNHVTNNPFSAEYEFTLTRKNIHIDVHTHLVNPLKFAFSEEEIFKRSMVHPYYNSKEIRVLSPNLNCVHLSLHYQKDCYIYHHSLVDFILLKKKENINLSDLRRSYSNLRNLISLISEVSNHIAFYYHKKLNTRLSLFLFLLPKTKKDVGKKSIRYRVSQLLMDIITFSTIHEFMRYYSTYFFRLMKKSLGKFN